MGSGHSRTVLSSLAVASVRPSGLKTGCTGIPPPRVLLRSAVVTRVRVARDHNASLTVRSEMMTAAMVLPSGLMAARWTTSWSRTVVAGPAGLARSVRRSPFFPLLAVMTPLRREGEVSEDQAAALLCAEAFRKVWARACPHESFQIH